MACELDNYSEEPLVTTYVDGQTTVEVGDPSLDQLRLNIEHPKNRYVLNALGLIAVSTLTFLALRAPQGVDATAGSQIVSPLASSESTVHYPPADYYRFQDPNKAHLWVAVDETPPTPTPTKPADYYSNPAYLTETPSPTKTPPSPVDPGAYRTADPHNPNWAPVGEYWTPTPTKPAGYYTNPDLLIPTGTPVPTEQE